MLAVAPFVGHVDPAMYAWPALNLVICLTPAAIWWSRRNRQPKEPPK